MWSSCKAHDPPEWHTPLRASCNAEDGPQVRFSGSSRQPGAMSQSELVAVILYHLNYSKEKRGKTPRFFAVILGRLGLRPGFVVTRLSLVDLPSYLQ